MALFTEARIRRRAQDELLLNITGKDAKQLLTESASMSSRNEKFDVFLSHSIQDANLILGMKKTLEDLKLTVYVDWIDDPQLDRSKISRSTAEILKERMVAAHSLFYVATESASYSKWMPWEWTMSVF